MTFRSIAFAAATAATFALPGIAQAYWGQATTSVNMRACASTSCPAIMVVPPGSQVWVDGSTGSWYHVNYGGYQGYMSSGYVATAYAAPRTQARPQVTLGFTAGNRPPAPAFGFYTTPTWDNRYNAWYDGRQWYYNGRWYGSPPTGGFSFGFNFGR